MNRFQVTCWNSMFFDRKCCQLKMQICYRINHNSVVLMTFGFFPHPGSHVHQFSYPNLCNGFENAHLLSVRMFVESEICCQSVGSDFCGGIFNSQRLWELKANGLRGGCCICILRIKSLMKPQVDKMCSGRMCISLVGLILMDFKVAWWAFLQIHLTCRATTLCVSAAIRLRPHETLVNSDADKLTNGSKSKYFSVFRIWRNYGISSTTLCRILHWKVTFQSFGY